MQIISHRGYWQEVKEKNTHHAFVRSFSLGFGTETDVRDCQGKLVIAHDPPTGNELTLDELLELAKPTHLPLAINIKADGLALAVQNTMKRHQYQNWFVFDMSIPDTRMQLSAKNPVYVRMSEVESSPPYLHSASGIWLDAFDNDEWRIDALKKLAQTGLPICIVSPELHQRQPLPFWESLKIQNAAHNHQLTLCTDLPEQAAQFFIEGKS